MAFVSYDNYKNRIEKLAKFKNFVVKYRFLIMGVLAVIIGGISALLATKGMITTDITLSSSTYTYGEAVNPTAASAFLSDVTYEYTLQGKDEWNTEKPVKVGKYSARAVSNKVIGKGYGKTVDFEILPKQVEFAFGNEASLRYGDKPKNYSIDGLVLADRIDVNGAAFSYAYNDEATDASEWTVDVTVAAGSVKIVDAAGNDSSNCYIYETAEKTFALTKRTITVALQNSSATYRGAEISYTGELKAPDLAEGDSIAFETSITQNGNPATLLNAGTYGITVKDGSVKIQNASGAEVTKRYNLGTPVDGTFTVNRKYLSITTQGGNKVYDGTALSSEGGTPDGLITGHGLSSIGTAPTIVDVGTVQNVQTFDILDANGNPVSDNYDYKNNYNYGYLTVIRRPLTVTTEGGEWEYDGTAHPVTESTATGLADGQVLVENSYSSEKAINVDDSGKNTLTFSIVWAQSGLDVDINNYEITRNYGDIKITARPLKVVTDGDSRPYNGTKLTVETYVVTYAGEKSGQTDAFIKYGEDLSYNPAQLPQIINVGTKENAINFAVPNNNYYLKESEYGTLEVTQAEITVTLSNATCDYGDPLDKLEPEITIGGSGIIGGKLFGSDTFNPAFLYDGAAPSRLNKGTYTISLDTANSTFTYGNDEPVSEPNYKITSTTTGKLTVESRGITVYLNDTTVIYGNSLIYAVGNETVEGVVKEQTVQVDATQVVFDTPSQMPDKGTYPGKISCPKTAITVLSDGTPVTSNYDLKVEVSTLYVNARPITVQAKDMLGIIYGETFDYEYVEGNYANTPDLVAGEKLTINNVFFDYLRNTIPTVGEYGIIPDVSQITIVKADGKDSRGNYVINPEGVAATETNGTLEIVKRPVKFVSHSDETLIYNGQPQYCEGYDPVVDIPNYYPVLSIHTVKVIGHTEVTDVEKNAKKNELTYDIQDGADVSVIGNYDVDGTECGTLKVNPKPITVQLNNYSATYGESYAYQTGAGNYDNTVLCDLVTGETLEVLDVTYEFGTVQYPDVREAAYRVRSDTFKVTKADGTDGTGNYEITPVDGSLEIVKRDITVQLLTYSAVYGESYAYATGAGNYDKRVLCDLVTGETLEVLNVTYEFGTVQYPEVRTAAYTVSLVSYEILKSDKTTSSYNNYNVTPVDGALTITKRTITVTLNDIKTVEYGNEVEYVGGNEKVENAIGVCTVDFNTENLKFNPDEADATYIYPDAGTYDVDCEAEYITVLSGGDDVSHNYNVNIVSGSLEIETRKIKVKPTSYSVEYGKIFNYFENAKPNYDKLTEGSLATFGGKEETLYIFVDSLKFDGYVIWDVGSYTFTPNRYTVTRGDGHDSTDNYEVDFENGTLTITQKVIEVTLNKLGVYYGYDEYCDKTYAEQYAETVDEVEITPAEKLKLTFGFTKDGNPVENPRKVGEYNVIITNGKTNNYEIVPKGDAKFIIYQKVIYIIPESVSAVYGDSFNYPTGKSNYADYRVSGIYKYFPSYGEEIEIFVEYDLNNQTVPAVGLYNAVCTGVKLYYPDDTTENGELHKISNFDATGSNVSGYALVFEASDFADKLEITAREIKVTLNEMPDAVYTGLGIAYKSGGETADNLVNGHYLEVNPNGIEFEEKNGSVYPNVGKYTIKATNENFIKIYFEDENGVKTYVTENYTVTEVINGTLTINACEITVTIGKATCLYGDPLDELVPEITVTGLENGDEFNRAYLYLKDGKVPARYDFGDYDITLDGDNCSFTYTNGAPSTTENYKITECKDGTLTINKRTLNITFKPVSIEYGTVIGSTDPDGTPYVTWLGDEPTDYPDSLSITLNELTDIEGDGFAEGENIYYICFYSAKEVKNVDTYDLSDMAIRIKYADGTRLTVYRTGSYKESNYDVNIDQALILTITQKDLTVTLGDITATYGNEIGYKGGEKAEGLLRGHVVSVSTANFADWQFTAKENGYTYPEAGKYGFTCAGEDITVEDGDGLDATLNYDITVKEGALTVNTRTVTVKLNGIGDVYYGDKVEYNGETATNLLEGHEVVVDAEKVMKNYQNLNVGKHDLICDREDITVEDDDGNVLTRNYDIRVEANKGGLNIIARKIIVELKYAEGYSVIYGYEIDLPEITGTTVNGDTVTGGLIYKNEDTGEEYKSSGLASNKHLPAGNYLVYLDLDNYEITYTNGAPSTTKNYVIEEDDVIPASLTVSKRPITVALKDFKREYGILNFIMFSWQRNFTLSDSTWVSGELDEFLYVEGDLAAGEEFKTIVFAGYGANRFTTFRDVGKYELRILSLGISYEGSGNNYNIYEEDGGNVGNYEVNIIFLEDRHAILEITPKAITVDLNAYSFTYGEEEDFRADFSFSTGKDLAFEETLSLSAFYAVKDNERVTDRLNAGDYTLDADPEDTESTKIFDKEGKLIVNGWKNYEMTFSGTLTVNARPVTVVLSSVGSVKYGKKLSYATGDGNYVNNPDLVYGEKLEVVVSWSFDGESIEEPKNAGTYYYSLNEDKSKIFDENFNEITAGIKNYTISCTSKLANISKYGITLTIYDEAIYYGDELQGKSGVFYPIDFSGGDLPYDETVEVAYKYIDNAEAVKVDNPTEVGTYSIMYLKHQARNEDGTVSEYDNYSITVDREGTLKIKQRPITVNTQDLPTFVFGETVVYPVEPDNHGYVGGMGLPAGQHLTITSVEYYYFIDGTPTAVEGVPTAAGTYYIVPTGVEIYDENGKKIDTERNYDISYPQTAEEISLCGTVTILPQKIRLVTESKVWTYDGTEHDYKVFTLELLGENDELLNKTIALTDEEREAVITDYATIKNVGTTENEINCDFSKIGLSLNIAYKDFGTLEVIRREITIESATTSFVYNGAAQSDDSHEVTSEDKIVPWHSLVKTNPATVTNVAEGEVSNVFTYQIFDGEEEVTTYYDITFIPGKISVTPRPIVVITGVDGETSKYYDGTPLVNERYDTYYSGENDDGKGGLLNGDALTVNDYEKMICAGTQANKVTFTPASANYVITGYEQCTLTIEKKTISIALIGNGNLTYGDETYPDEFGNFTLLNGTSLAPTDELKVAVKYIVKGKLEKEVRNVGTYTVVFDKDNSKVETTYGVANGIDNYIINATDGEIEIKPKAITVTLKTLPNKVYGEEFDDYPTGAGNYVSDDVLAYDEDTLEVFVRYPDGDIGKYTPVDDYAVAIDYCEVNGERYDRNGQDNLINAGNYTITFVGSTLTVDPRPIKIATGSAEQVYNGEYLYSPENSDGYTVKAYYNNPFGGEPDGLVDSVENVLQLDLSSIKKIINAGTVSNEVEYVLLSNNYKLLTEEFSYGELTVKKRPVSIVLKQIGNATYGNTLTYPDGSGEEANFGYAEDTEYGLVDTESLVIAVKFRGEDNGYTTPKTVGKYFYEFDLSHSVVNGSIGGNGIDNYSISCKDEKFAFIDKLYAELALDGWTSEVYDGNPHVYEGSVNIVGGGEEGKFAYGETFALAVDYYADGSSTPMVGNPVNAGAYTVKINYANSTIGGYAPDKNYDIYDPENVYITFTVSKREVTVSVDNETRPYDGKVYDYLKENENFSVSNVVSGEKIVPSVYYTDEELTGAAVPKNAGTYNICFNASFTVSGANDVAGNYDIKTDLTALRCKLEITQREITVTVHDRTIELPGEVINPVEDESYDTDSHGDSGIVSDDLKELTLVYSYTYLGKDKKSEIPVNSLEEINKIGFYRVELSFEGPEEILNNYDFVESKAGILEITATKVLIELNEYDTFGEELIYSGSPISVGGFSFEHYHVGYEPAPGFAAADVPVYKTEEVAEGVPSYRLLFTRNGKSSYDLPVDAGTYTVKFVFEDVDDEKYKVYNEGTISVTIAPRAVTVNLSGFDAEEDLKGYLTYSYSKFPSANGLVNVSVSNLVEGEASTAKLYYYNDNPKYGEVEYNYAGNYTIKARIVNAEGKPDGNYYVDGINKVAFTVNQAVIYVTPKDKTAVYSTAVKELKLEAGDYDIRNDGELYGSDVLSIEGSAVNKAARQMPVTITKAQVTQGGRDVTDCYDVRFRYDANDELAGKAEWYTEQAFKATLSFTPVTIRYKQAENAIADRYPDYTGRPIDLGLDRNNLGSYIEILDEDEFVGDYTLRYQLVTVVDAREYAKWIQILVFCDGINVTGLYDFKLQNAEETKVVVHGTDFYIEDLTDGDIQAAWNNKDAEDSVLSLSKLYGYNDYYVLDKSCYSCSGLDEENGHGCEVLVRYENGALVVKIIVFRETTSRVDVSRGYTLNLPAGLNAELVNMSKVLAPDTTN